MYKIFQENLNWFLQNYQENEFNTHILFTYMYVDGYAQKRHQLRFVLQRASKIPQFVQFANSIFSGWLIAFRMAIIFFHLFYEVYFSNMTRVLLLTWSFANFHSKTTLELIYLKQKKSKIVVNKNIKIEWTLFSPPMNIFRNYIYFQACIRSLRLHVSGCVRIFFWKSFLYDTL